MLTKATKKRIQEELNTINESIKNLLLENQFETTEDDISIFRNKDMSIDTFFGIEDIKDNREQQITSFSLSCWFEETVKTSFLKEYKNLNKFEIELSNFMSDKEEIITIGNQDKYEKGETNYKTYQEFKKMVITPIKEIIKRNQPLIEEDLKNQTEKKVTYEETELTEMKSNGGYIKQYELKTENNLYKLYIKTESYVSQSYIRLSFFNGEEWKNIISQNPQKEYNIDIAYKRKEYIPSNTFDKILSDYIQLIEKLETKTQQKEIIYETKIVDFERNLSLGQKQLIKSGDSIYRTTVYVESYDFQSKVLLEKLTTKGFKILESKNPQKVFKIDTIYHDNNRKEVIQNGNTEKGYFRGIFNKMNKQIDKYELKSNSKKMLGN